MREILRNAWGTEIMKGGGELILAVEDEEMIRDFLQTILGQSGYKVILAADGMEGFQTYTQKMKEIDLVLLDMGLPGMSGEDVLSNILSMNPNAKVISTSGYIEPEVRKHALQNRAVDYLPKPYSIDDLLLKVHRSLYTGSRPAMQDYCRLGR